jgi:hypothetical protein
MKVGQVVELLKDLPPDTVFVVAVETDVAPLYEPAKALVVEDGKAHLE